MKHCLINQKGSAAFGEYTTASGNESVAFGSYTTAQPYASFVIGKYNEVSGDQINWVATDPLFVIGNGADSSNRNNAVTVLKNGNVGIGTNSPNSALTVTTNNVNGVAIDLRTDDYTLANADYSVARIYADFTTTSYSDSHLYLQTATGNNSWKTGLTIDNGYAKLETSSGAPPDADCDLSTEYGRMKVDSTASTSNLFVCTPNGWATLTP